jgi:hypothetical protein
MLSWLERMCLGAANRRIAFWVITTFVALLIVAENYRYARNFLVGPFSTSAAELDKVSDPDRAEDLFIRVTGSKTIDTGIQEITTTTRNGVKESDRVTAAYFALLVGDRFLVVKSASAPSGTVEGELKPMPQVLRGELTASLGLDNVQQNIRPLLLDTEGFRYPGYWAIGVGLVLMFCLFRYMRPALALRKDVSKSSVIQRVRSWGDPISLAVEIEEENRNKVEYKSQGVRITDKYLIEKRLFTFNVFRFQDLLWAYKRVTQHSVNLIPTGKSYNAVMIFYGGSATVSGRQKKLDELLQRTSAKAPWAIFGFSKELEEHFKKRTEEFCMAVEMRKRDVRSGTSG